MDELPEVTVPPLPPNLVPRPEALEALREKVLANQGQQSYTIALTAIQGMGGIGKTVLAQMLCRDETIKKAFPDGIFWQTIGKESEIKSELRLRAVVEALRSDADKSVKPGMAAADQYRLLMRDKAALLVIDDVWNADDVVPWLAESTRSRVLFTTRDTSIGGAVGAEEHWAEQLSQLEARNVLKKWAGVTEELPPEGEELIKECGRLALGIAIVGAMLRGKPKSFWQRTLDLLRSAELDKVSAQFPGQHKSLFRALHASVEQLDDLQRESYLALAVLL